jgi:hypothetical protein
MTYLHIYLGLITYLTNLQNLCRNDYLLYAHLFIDLNIMC